MSDEATPPDETENDFDILNLGGPGEYRVGKPHFIGKFPERKDPPSEPASHTHHCKPVDANIDFPPEPRVLGPDDPKMTKFGFTVDEVNGTEVVLVPDDLQGRDPDSLTEAELDRLKALTSNRHEHHLKSFDGLKVGDDIMTLGFGGWAWSVVDELRPEKKNGSALSPLGETLYMLEFDDDDRHCWACIGHGNLIGLKRLEIQR